MNIFSNFLLNTNNIKKDTFIWNSISAFLNSFQTMLLLLTLTHIGTSNDSSIFVMAYSIGNLLYNFSKFGVRQFQVTDLKEKYQYSDYFNARIISTLLMIISVVIYNGYNFFYVGYSIKKVIVVTLICIYKGIEAFEDVFHGRMQQKGRLDVAGKIWSIRLFTFIFTYTIFYIFSKNIVFTTFICVLITGIQCILLNLSVLPYFIEKPVILLHFINNNKWRNILIECFPLFLSALLNMYLGNAPKYIIDEKVSDAVQTEFNIVFMPVFVVALLSNFVFQPSLMKIGILWQSKKIIELKKLIRKLVIVPIVADLVCTLAAGIAGIPILSTVYGIDLTDYKLILIIFMIAGGAIAIMNLFIMILTTMRKQKQLLFGYSVSSAIIYLFGSHFLINYGLLGLSISFILILILIDLFFWIIYNYYLSNH